MTTSVIPRALRLTDVAFGLEYRDWWMTLPFKSGPDPAKPWGWQCRACSNGYPSWYATRKDAEQGAHDHAKQVIHGMRERERRRAWEIVTALLPILAALPAPKQHAEVNR